MIYIEYITYTRNNKAAMNMKGMMGYRGQQENSKKHYILYSALNQILSKLSLLSMNFSKTMAIYFVIICEICY